MMTMIRTTIKMQQKQLWKRKPVKIAAAAFFLAASMTCGHFYQTQHVLAAEASYIGEAKAKAAALSHAGVKEANITSYRCRLDYDDGYTHYDIDFDCQGYEYEYEIDSLDGSVIKSEKEKISKISSSQSKTYIKKSAAKTAALNHAGVKEKNIQHYRCKLDYDDGAAVYEIDFDSKGYEYEYEIDALDGSVLKSKKEKLAVSPSHSADESTSRIGKKKAQTAAFTHAGVTAKNVQNYRCKLDYEDGYPVYEIDFDCRGYEYDYEIDALDGSVLKSKKEMITDAVSNQSDTYIGEEKAKSAALSHAGVKEKNIKSYRCKLDYDDGYSQYEIDFICGNYEYEYEIDSIDGSILKHEKEKIKKTPSTQGNSYIGETKATTAALSHAGVSKSKLRKLKCELEHDDGQTFYEVEFESGKYEYEYEIDAFDGSILKFEKDLDD